MSEAYELKSEFIFDCNDCHYCLNVNGSPFCKKGKENNAGSLSFLSNPIKIKVCNEFASNKTDIVKCKHCIHASRSVEYKNVYHCIQLKMDRSGEFFCAYGKVRD